MMVTFGQAIFTPTDYTRSDLTARLDQDAPHTELWWRSNSAAI